MSGLLPCICSDSCQADTTCYRPPRFQVHMDRVPYAQQPPFRRRTDACANHLGGMVQAMTRWAREQELTEGDLTVMVIDPPPTIPEPGRRRSYRRRTRTDGLVFSVIPFGA